MQSAAPEKATFVHELLESSAAEQSPTVSALGRSADASQLAKKMEVWVMQHTHDGKRK